MLRVSRNDFHLNTRRVEDKKVTQQQQFASSGDNADLLQNMSHNWNRTRNATTFNFFNLLKRWNLSDKTAFSQPTNVAQRPSRSAAAGGARAERHWAAGHLILDRSRKNKKHISILLIIGVKDFPF